jgi:hypothetical protein
VIVAGIGASAAAILSNIMIIIGCTAPRAMMTAMGLEGIDGREYRSSMRKETGIAKP